MLTGVTRATQPQSRMVASPMAELPPPWMMSLPASWSWKSFHTMPPATSNQSPMSATRNRRIASAALTPTPQACDFIHDWKLPVGLPFSSVPCWVPMSRTT